MKNSHLGKSLLVALSAGVLLAGCGGTVEEMDPTAHQTAPQAGEVQAMGPTECDPTYYCKVRSSSIRCADGFYVQSYWTSDGWCIESDACDNHGGPTICPVW